MRHEKVIWLALFVSTLIYLLIVWQVAGKGEGTYEEALRKPLVLPLYAVAVVVFGAAFVARRKVRVPRTAFVVALALFESCAIYGVLAAMLVKDWRLFFAPWALALIGFMTMWPGNETEARLG